MACLGVRMPTKLSFDIDAPRYDQTTYWGRAQHFFETTNPVNILARSHQLDAAKELVLRYRKGELRDRTVDEEELWRAKTLYNSAFHPDTGEKMFLPGRMSAQVPFNMVITGCMMTFYRTTPAVIFWQWFNQSFNALVNYTNRSGDAVISTNTLVTSYCAATGGALATALGLNSLVRSLPALVGRLVPFVACSAANCINIPLMRRLELTEGTPVETSDGKRVGLSKVAAREGIAMVTLSRIGMAAPGMVLIPVIINNLDRKGLFRKHPRLSAPLQVLLCGLILTVSTPLCCAIFEQRASISVSRLEPDIQRQVKNCDVLFYNKGL